MVGDRKSDVKASKSNRLYVIGCDFGFAEPGELNEADSVIWNFSEIKMWHQVAISTR